MSVKKERGKKLLPPGKSWGGGKVYLRQKGPGFKYFSKWIGGQNEGGGMEDRG